MVNSDSRTESVSLRGYLRFSAGLALLGLLAVGIALSGVFFRPLILLPAIASLGAVSFFLIRSVMRDSVTTGIVAILSLTISVILLIGTEPFLFSGRDQGAIAEASVLLAEHGGLRSSSVVSDIFHGIYGSGSALHFPGFHYATDGRLVTQFPIGTVAFFAVFVSLFGTDGLIIVNGLLLCSSLFLIFLLARALSDERLALGTFLASSVSFLPLFVSRLPLSENVFLTIFLALSLSTVSFLRKPDRETFLITLLLGAFLSVIRIEGVFAFVATVAIFVLAAPARDFLSRERPELLLRTLVLVSVFLAANLAANLPLYRSILGATWDHMTVHGSGTPGDIPVLFPLWQVFGSYGLLFPFLFGLAGTALLLARRRFVALVPSFLALPAFLFFIDPNITPDHPWMLRRFLFSLWPALVLTVPAALHHLSNRLRGSAIGHLAAIAVFGTVFLGSVPATAGLLSFHEYEGLSGQTAALADLIGGQDLLLIDREATGDPYAIPAAPLRLLHDRHAVYFFNPEDYAKIPQETFDRIYLLAPIRNAETLWQGIPATLVPVESVRFSFDRIRPTPLRDPTLPSRETVASESVLFRLDPLPVTPSI